MSFLSKPKLKPGQPPWIDPRLLDESSRYTVPGQFPVVSWRAHPIQSVWHRWVWAPWLASLLLFMTLYRFDAAGAGRVSLGLIVLSSPIWLGTVLWRELWRRRKVFSLLEDGRVIAVASEFNGWRQVLGIPVPDVNWKPDRLDLVSTGEFLTARWDYRIVLSDLLDVAYTLRIGPRGRETPIPGLNFIPHASAVRRVADMMNSPLKGSIAFSYWVGIHWLSGQNFWTGFQNHFSVIIRHARNVWEWAEPAAREEALGYVLNREFPFQVRPDTFSKDFAKKPHKIFAFTVGLWEAERIYNAAVDGGSDEEVAIDAALLALERKGYRGKPVWWAWRHGLNPKHEAWEVISSRNKEIVSAWGTFFERRIGNRVFGVS